MDKKSSLYVIDDLGAEQTGPVFEAPNDKIAMRQFLNTTKDIPYSQDYELLKIGDVEVIRENGVAVKANFKVDFKIITNSYYEDLKVIDGGA